ncbi:hypothetical protein VB264_09085 [Arcicella aquatica]|uniref:Uncharacterized protein n=1 Tax=Arcicella aquatica TaxID=217141 RepID=A0ABU5QM60_9BACT|nr:hypothetical protein [Arcicella aquatica]MEA5257939.1 hypothetical protein [Arcicella aquatica]
MKKLYTLVILILLVQQSFGQNTFPTTGNVGIGTTTPSTALEVNGVIKQIFGRYFYKISDTTDVIIKTSRSDNNQVGYFKTNGWGRFSFSNGLAVGLDFPANNYSGLLVNGNVGLNTTSPSEKLDVVGNIKYSQLLKPNGITGTDRQVLMNISGTSNAWTTLTTLHLSDFSTEMAKYLKASGGTLTGNIGLPSDKTITFNDKTATYPTAQGGLVWDLNAADKASIYAYQPTADITNFVFQVADDGLDRFVFKRKDWNGAVNDVYHLYMDDNKVVFNYPDLDGTTGTSKNMDFYIMGNGQPNKNLTSPIFKTVASTNRVGINTGSPQEALDINGNLKLNGKLKYGTNDSRTETRNDAGLRGDAGAQSGFYTTSSPVNYPKNATGFWHLLDVRHSNLTDNYAMQLAGSFGDQRLYFRKTNNNPTQPWREIPTLDTTGALTVNGTLTLYGKLKYGPNDSRTETRDNAGLRGDAGAQSGFFVTQTPLNYPKNASSWWHLLDVRSTGTSNNYAMQLAGSFFDQKLYFRKVNDNPAQTWTEVATLDTTGALNIVGLKLSGKLKYGANDSRSEIRDNAGLRGDAGAQSGFFYTQAPVNYPTNATSYWHLLDVRSGGITNNYAMQFSGSYYDQKLYFRKTSDNPAQPWVEVPTIDTTGRIKFDNDLASSKKSVILGGYTYGGAIKFSANSTTANNRNLELGNINNSGVFSSSVTIGAENGNVSIGTNTIYSAYKLAIAGDMIAERVVVKLKTAWPDYVFAPSYQLPSLNEVEKYITNNAHLPGIPSAKDIEEKGIDVGDTNAKLLRKIEELTLYMIQMQKTNEAQNAEIALLKNEILKSKK